MNLLGDEAKSTARGYYDFFIGGYDINIDTLSLGLAVSICVGIILIATHTPYLIARHWYRSIVLGHVKDLA